MMIEASKKQIVQFYVDRFANDKGEHPSFSAIDAFKKSELTNYITIEGLEEEFNKYIEAQEG